MNIKLHNFDGEFLHNLIRLDYDHKNTCVIGSGMKVNGVIIGDSIMQYCEMNLFFNMKNILNRGINGEESCEVLSRFEQDVLQFKPKFVVIACGVNDTSMIQGNPTWRIKAKYPIDIENEIVFNISKMVEICKENDIKAYVCSILPISENLCAFGTQRNQIIKIVNKKLKGLDCKYVDIHSKFTNIEDITTDGVHPNYNGYKILTDVFLNEISELEKP